MIVPPEKLLVPRYPAPLPAIDGAKVSERDPVSETHRSVTCQAAFAAAMGPWWREGMGVLDLGCGTGRFANFLAGRIRRFRYWGTELPQAAVQLRPRWWVRFNDPRIAFGLARGSEEKEGIDSATVGLLLSVLTHLPIQSLTTTLDRLLPIAERGGALVFSIFLAPCAREGRPKPTAGCPYFREVFYTWPDLLSLTQPLGLRVKRVGTFPDRDYVHVICRATLA